MGVVWEKYGKLTLKGSHYWGSIPSHFDRSEDDDSLPNFLTCERYEPGLFGSTRKSRLVPYITIQGGPLLVISVVLTPFIGVITPVTQL